MFIPFLTDDIKVSHDEKNDMITITGNFGMSFKCTCRRVLSNDVKLMSLFSSLKLTEISFYGFFLYEVKKLLEEIMNQRFKHGLNIVVINKVLETLEEIEKHNYRDTTFKLDLKKIEDNMAFKIMKHQEPIFDRYRFFKEELGYRGMLVDAAPGTGKTFSSLAIAEAVGADRVYIICPLATVDNVWKSSICGNGLIYKNPQECMSFKATNKYNNEKFVIIHYEALDKAMDIFKDKNKGLNNITVIVDESHNLASSISKRTTLAIEFINMVKASNVLCLSGTPLKSTFKELGVVFSMIDSRFTNRFVEDRFYKLYKSPNSFLADLLTERYQGASVKVVKESIELEPPITTYINVKLKNGEDYTLKKIREDLKKFVKERSEEIKELEPVINQDYAELVQKAYNTGRFKPSVAKMIWYENSVEKIKKNPQACLFMYPEMLKEVNQYEEELAMCLDGEDRKKFREVKTLYKYPILKIQGEALGLIITRARINCHADMARELCFKDIVNTTTKKTLVFSSYINVCKAAEEKCIKEKYKPIGVYGDTVVSLSSYVKKFTDDKKVNPLITTYKALSTGVPLIAANVVICLDLPFRLYMYDQAISRVWRLGQDKQVHVYILSLDTGEEPNINSRNIDIITFFKEEIEKITGYKSNIELDKNVAPGMESLELYMAGLNSISGYSGIEHKNIPLLDW